MVANPFTEFYNTPNKSIRQNVPRRGVVLHHAAMTNLDQLIRLEMGAKQVSSNATCKDDRLPEMFPTDGPFRAWSLSDAYWDSALRSVETCNETITGWTVSDASHWSLARAVAYWAEKDGFWPHRDGNPKTWTVLGHREVYTIHGGSYGTACPGGMDLDLVTARAQQLLKSVPPTPNSSKENDMIYYIANTDSGDGLIPNGSIYVQGAEGPLRRIIDAEWQVVVYWDKNGVKASTWSVPGDVISALVNTVGLREIVGGNGTDAYRPTGRIVYTAAD